MSKPYRKRCSQTRKFQAEHEDALLRKQNVNGVALGTKVIKGEDTGKPAILVLVRSKMSKDLLAKEDLVPPKINEVPTDVLEVGEIFAGGPRARVAEPLIRERFAVGGGDGSDLLAREQVIEELEEITPEVLRHKRRPALRSSAQPRESRVCSCR